MANQAEELGPIRIPRAGERVVPTVIEHKGELVPSLKGEYQRLAEDQPNLAQLIGKSHLTELNNFEKTLNFLEPAFNFLDAIDNGLEIGDIPVGRAGIVNYLHAYAKTGDSKFAFDQMKEGRAANRVDDQFGGGEHPLVGDAISNYLQDIRQGLVDEEEVPFFVKTIAASPSASDAYSMIYGLAADIAVDPVSYLGGAGIRRFGQGMKGLINAVAKAALPEQAYKSALHGVKRAEQLPMELFQGTKQVVADVAKVATDPIGGEFNKIRKIYNDRMHHAAQYSKGDARRLDKQVQGAYLDLKKQMPSLTRDEFNKFLTVTTEQKVPDISQFVPSQIKAIANNSSKFSAARAELLKRNADRLAREQAAGEEVAKLGTGWINRRDEYRDALRKAQVETLDAKTPKKVVVTHNGKKREFDQDVFKEKLERVEDVVQDYENLNYLRHSRTEEATEFMKQQAQKNTQPAYEIGQGRGFRLPRMKDKKFAGKSILELNELSMQGKGPLGPDFVGQLLIDDPVHLDTLRAQSHYQSLAAMDMRDSLDQLPQIYSPQRMLDTVNKGKKGKKYTNSDSARKQLDSQGLLRGMREPSNPLFKGYYLPEDLAINIDKVIKGGPNTMFGGGMGEIPFKVWDYSTRIFKNTTLAPFAEYHWNNIIGNTWNIMAMRGVEGLNPQHYITGMQLATDLSQGKISTALGTQVSKGLSKIGAQLPDSFPVIKDGVAMRNADGTPMRLTTSELSNELKEHATGVWGKGFIATEVQSSIDDILGKMNVAAKLEGIKRAPTVGKKARKGFELGEDILGYPIRKLKEFGEFFENTQRAGLYINGRLTGRTAQEASDDVVKALFNYDDISDFEKMFFKRVMPFYTYSRKNLPFQVASAVAHPERYRAAQFALQESNAAQTRGERESIQMFKYAPQWLATQLPSITEISPEGDVTFNIAGNALPYSDVLKAANGAKYMVDLAHPVLRAAYNYWNKTDPFTGEQMTEQDSKIPVIITSDGLTVERRTFDALRNIRAFVEVHKLMQAMNPDAYNTQLFQAKPNMPENSIEWATDFLFPGNSYQVNLNTAKNYQLQALENKANEAVAAQSVAETKVPKDPEARAKYRALLNKNREEAINKILPGIRNH